MSKYLSLNLKQERWHTNLLTLCTCHSSIPLYITRVKNNLMVLWRVLSLLYIVLCLCRAHVPSLHLLECYSIIKHILQLPLGPPHPLLTIQGSPAFLLVLPFSWYQFAFCVMKPEGGVDCWLFVGQRRRNCIQGPTSSCLIKRGHSLEAGERPACILWWVV